MITAGVDVGTRFIKVCVTDGESLRGAACAEMGANFDAIIRSLLKEARVQAQVGRWDIKKIIATGFGGHLVKKAAFTLGESACTARAAFFFDRHVGTVIDLGGLFITVATIDENGFLETTHINERCAAGSGKFLEMVAEAVEVPFAEISSCAAESRQPYSFSSNCAVFAESEIISKVNTGMKSSDILAGVIMAIASKAASLIEGAGAKDNIVLIGGLSKISAVREMLTGLTGRNMVMLPIDGQLIAAFGAALIAQGKIVRKRQRSSLTGGVA
ncbi:MAG: acyl-CoA dehydratase activase [Smithella sp.]|jgi:predicted CoA-substrate-specific enzyme activase